MKITVLMENTTKDTQYFTEHGLSLYIETANHNILFDTGQSSGFIENAHLLDTDISMVDIVYLSHGHYDHGGGLNAFLALNHHAKIYINSNAFSDLYSQKNDSTLSFIGIDKKLMNHQQVVLLHHDCTLDEELEVFTRISNKYPLPSMNHTLLVKKDLPDEELYVKDDFKHEQNLIIHENGKQILIAGCAHHGIMNILEGYNLKKGVFPDTVLSGFHLSSDTSGFIEDITKLEQISDYLKDTKSKYYTGHCTGLKPYEFLHERLGDQINYMYTGRLIDLN